MLARWTERRDRVCTSMVHKTELSRDWGPGVVAVTTPPSTHPREPRYMAATADLGITWPQAEPTAYGLRTPTDSESDPYRPPAPSISSTATGLRDRDC
jgi:hypothetical protein